MLGRFVLKKQQTAYRLCMPVSPSWVVSGCCAPCPKWLPSWVTPREIGVISPSNLGVCHATGHSSVFASVVGCSVSIAQGSTDPSTLGCPLH